MNASARVEITGLTVYPVKSCAGIALNEAPITRRGLVWDREWMVVDPEGVFVTQRQHPRMALVRTAIEARALRLEAPGMPSIRVPLTLREMAETPVRVWRHETLALDEGPEAAAWLSRFLDVPCRLVRWNPARRRLSNREYTGDIKAESAFADGYPILLAAEESLADLNARIGDPDPLPMDRFRANMVVRGASPYAEDQWTSMKAEGVDLRVVKPCTRCPITATDQATAVVGKEPLRTLATYRRHETLKGVVFAQNVVVADGFGRRLRVGMSLEVR